MHLGSFIFVFPKYWALKEAYRVPGWNDYVRGAKEKTDFWHKIWIDAGSPRSGVLFQIKKNAKSRYKYQVRKLKRREKHIRNQKLLNSFFKSNPTEFWREVKRAQMSSKNHNSPIVNGVSDPEAISNKLSSKFSETLNTQSGCLLNLIYLSIALT